MRGTLYLRRRSPLFDLLVAGIVGFLTLPIGAPGLGPSALIGNGPPSPLWSLTLTIVPVVNGLYPLRA